MTRPEQIVFVVNDDERVREAIGDLLEAHDMRATTFESARVYLTADKRDSSACLILDIELPDISGLDLQNQISAGDQPPIVLKAGRGDIPPSVQRPPAQSA